jgi:hypothetical protein
MNATIDLSIGFHTVPDNSAFTMRADRRQRVDRALEAIECVMLSRDDYLKRLVIFILANFACTHTPIVSRLRGFAAVSTCLRE